MNNNNPFNYPGNIPNNSDIINIIFQTCGDYNNNNFQIIIKAFYDDEFEFIQKKFLKKVKASGDIKFVFNSKRLVPELTVSELRILDRSCVLVVGKNIV